MLNQSAQELLAVYSALGFKMIPLAPVDSHSNGKRPLMSGWQEQATTNPSQVGQWFVENPNAGLGIVTGLASALCVIDVDPRNGGKDSLIDMYRLHGKFPETPVVETGGGGWHFYFRCNQMNIRLPKNLAPGIDVKWEGGFVCAPPTLHQSGQLYFWDACFHIENFPLPLLPNWLLELGFQPQSQMGKSYQSKNSTISFSEGNRNNALAKLFGKLLSTDLPARLSAELVFAANDRICKPPLNLAEVEAIILSISQRELQQRSIK